MAAMGGWGVLDYAENFAPDPFGWLQLGYASYLSSWALMNTGPAENNYGFWFPGPENDGASGWQFTSTKTGSAWMGSSFPGGVSEPRGPWHYDGEIDLGYGGALRMAGQQAGGRRGGPQPGRADDRRCGVGRRDQARSDEAWSESNAVAAAAVPE